MIYVCAFSPLVKHLEMKTTTEDELNKKSKEPEMDISAIQYLILSK